MPRQGLTRRDVLQACFRLIDEKGFEGFSMHELARRLDIRPASLYNHIENETTLLTRIGQTATERFASALTQAVSDAPEEDKIPSLVRAWWEFARMHPGLYTVAMRAAKSEEVWIKPVFYLPVEAVADGDDALRDLILATLHGFVSFENAGVFPTDGEEERLKQIIGGLAAFRERSTR